MNVVRKGGLACLGILNRRMHTNCVFLSLSSFYVNFPRLRGLDGFPQVPCFHTARSLAASFFRPHSSIVFFTPSSQVLTGRPTLLFPSTVSLLHAETMSPSCFLSRCPNHLNLPLSTTSVTPFIPKRSLKSTLLFLAFNDTPHIHLTIIISVLSNLCMSSLFIAHVSLPYINAFCTHTL